MAAHLPTQLYLSMTLKSLAPSALPLRAASHIRLEGTPQYVSVPPLPQPARIHAGLTEYTDKNGNVWLPYDKTNFVTVVGGAAMRPTPPCR